MGWGTKFVDMFEGEQLKCSVQLKGGCEHFYHHRIFQPDPPHHLYKHAAALAQVHLLSVRQLLQILRLICPA